MSGIESHVMLPLFQISSVLLLIFLIVEAVLKYQHKINFITSDLRPIICSAFKKQEIRSEQEPEKSGTEEYEPTFEQDFNEFAVHKDAGTTPALKPDVCMYEAIDYLIRILFPDKQPNVGDIGVHNTKAVNLITEKLRSSELNSWGLYVGEAVEREFSIDDWKYRELLPLEASIPTTKKPQTKTVNTNSGKHELTGLRVNFNQVKSIWLKKTKPNESTYDDMLLMDLFDYLEKNVDYSLKFSELDKEDIAFKIAMDIKDKASMGRLYLYGRIYGKQFDQLIDPINQLEKIKLDDWNDFSFTMNLEKREIQAENDNDPYNGNIYRDIQVERKQVLSIWTEVE